MLVRLSVPAVLKFARVISADPVIVRLVADVATKSKSFAEPEDAMVTPSTPAIVSSVAAPPVNPATVTVTASEVPVTSLNVIVWSTAESATASTTELLRPVAVKAPPEAPATFKVVRAFALTRPSVTAFVAVETLTTSIFVKPAGVTEVFRVAFTVSLVAPVPVSLSRELRV
jgi:hypothetical protein